VSYLREDYENLREFYLDRNNRHVGNYRKQKTVIVVTKEGRMNNWKKTCHPALISQFGNFTRLWGLG